MNKRQALKIVRKNLGPPYHRYKPDTWKRVLDYMDRRNLAYYDRHFWPLQAVSIQVVQASTTRQPKGLYKGVYTS